MPAINPGFAPLIAICFALGIAFPGTMHFLVGISSELSGE
jgi:hypothetical protein